MTSASRTLEQTLTTARVIAGGLVGGLVLVAAAALLLPRGPVADVLIAPAGIIGIVTPAIGYRLFHLLGERVPAQSGAGEQEAQYLRATILALAVTEAAAVFGIVVFALSGGLTAMIGTVSHLILTGALWPTEDRLELFASQGPAPDGDP